MKVLGWLGFYSCYINNLRLDNQPYYDLIKDSTLFHWTHEHEKVFQLMKDRISEDTILEEPSNDYPFHIDVDSSNVATGWIEQPSTSAPTRPLTPIQQFLWNSRKSKTREPKYFRPQPSDPNSQSVLCTLTRQGYKL